MNLPTTPIHTTHPPRDRAAFDRTAAARATVDLTRAPAYNLDAVHAAAQALGIAQRVRPFRDALCSLTGFDITHLDHLEDYAHALLFVQWTLVARSERVRQLPELAEEGYRLRALLLAYASLLELQGRVAPQVVARLRDGSGYRDLVEDLGALVTIFHDLPDTTGPGAPIQIADVERALAVADAITHALGADGDADLPHDALTTERRRLGVLLLRAHAQLRRGLGYLRADEGDVLSLVPSLYVPARRRGEPAPDDTPTLAVPPIATDHAAPAAPHDSPFET